MSWSLAATGDPNHLKEYVKRHLHHYNQDLSADEKGVIRHVVGHGLDQMDAGSWYYLNASGHADARHYNVDVRIDRVEMTDLPPAVPEEVAE
ncbi:hypothetical protein [Sulfobacillus harzensis]|uniref:Uncharacterized protein n=1 Tax=Sulfobacillus harzensis TaxID=2729629 RepID=A0A7Y0Q2C4_9FIRM|nr:hypothetical protein [Sulfobacillus harzensis]NMP22190.1 hypothetical protein [Sulfobacillus harzensis]